MKLTIYSYSHEERGACTQIYSFTSKEARDEALREQLKEIAEDEGTDLDPDGCPTDWAEELGLSYTYDSCVVKIPILGEMLTALEEAQDILYRQTNEPVYSGRYPKIDDAITKAKALK